MGVSFYMIMNRVGEWLVAYGPPHLGHRVRGLQRNQDAGQEAHAAAVQGAHPEAPLPCFKAQRRISEAHGPLAIPAGGPKAMPQGLPRGRACRDTRRRRRASSRECCPGALPAPAPLSAGPLPPRPARNKDFRRIRGPVTSLNFVHEKSYAHTAGDVRASEITTT